MTDVQDIAAMIARHARLGDDGEWEQWAANFAEDAVLEVGDVTIVGRQAIVDSIRSRSGGRRGRHFLGPSTITVTGDTAKAVTDSLYVQSTMEQSFAVTGVGRYCDTLGRSDGGRWHYLIRNVDQLGAST